MVSDGARLVVSAAPSYDPDDADSAAASLWFAWDCARDDTGGACATAFRFGDGDALRQFNGRPPSVAEVADALDKYAQMAFD